MTFFSLAGDVLWIIALSIMASASRSAWMRIDPDVAVPMSFTQDGRPGIRVSRGLALSAIPVLGFVVGIVLVVFNRNIAGDPSQAMILFGVRSLAAALFAIAHLRWLKAALEQLETEGRLRDPR
jgi:hypothetical protein